MDYLKSRYNKAGDLVGYDILDKYNNYSGLGISKGGNDFLYSRVFFIPKDRYKKIRDGEDIANKIPKGGIQAVVKKLRTHKVGTNPCKELDNLSRIRKQVISEPSQVMLDVVSLFRERAKRFHLEPYFIEVEFDGYSMEFGMTDKRMNYSCIRAILGYGFYILKQGKLKHKTLALALSYSESDLYNMKIDSCVEEDSLTDGVYVGVWNDVTDISQVRFSGFNDDKLGTGIDSILLSLSKHYNKAYDLYNLASLS